MSVTGIRKVLVYDKDRFFRKLVQRILWSFEIPDVFAVEDLDEASRVLRNSKIDCVIIDWSLEDNEDLALVKRIRKGEAGPTQAMPVILCTGHTQTDRIFAARDIGVDEITIKPVKPDDILSRMLSSIHRPRPFIDVEGYTGPCRRRRDIAVEFEERRGESEEDSDDQEQ